MKLPPPSPRILITWQLFYAGYAANQAGIVADHGDITACRFDAGHRRPPTAISTRSWSTTACGCTAGAVVGGSMDVLNEGIEPA